MLRVISEVRPRWIIAENVSGLISIDKGLVLERVFTDLEGEGYQVQPFVVPACAVGAPHRRDRIWIVAYSERRGTFGPGFVQRPGKDSGEMGLRKAEDAESADGNAPNSTQHVLNRTGNRRQGGREEFADTDGDATDTIERMRPELSQSNKRRVQKQNRGDAANPRNQRSQRRGKLGEQKKKRQTAPGGRQDVAGCCGEDAADTIGQYDDHGRHGAGQILRERREAPEIQRCRDAWNEPWIEAASRFCNLDAGLSEELAQPKGWRTNALKALGNSVVPPLVYEIFKAIKKADEV
jgi:DNA (cytosine-5)-methyltransferase 1